MDAATLIERIERELQEHDPIFTALREALDGCDPELRFAVPRSVLESLQPPRVTSAEMTWNQRGAALYGAA